MAFQTIALQSPGDMGHAIGALLALEGRCVRTCLAGRSALTRERAARAGLEEVSCLEELLADADLVLSILPPAAAAGFAAEVARVQAGASSPPLFLEANAVSPATARGISTTLAEAGVRVVDGGLIGASPRPERPATRLYVSGPGSDALLPLSSQGERGALEVRDLGGRVGDASALKMTYASITKGTLGLYAAALVSAARLGVYEPLTRELGESQTEAWRRMQAIPFLPADSARWIGEMEEIAATYADAGAPEGFHRAAADVYRWMAESPFASETRESVDRGRSLEATIAALAEIVAKRG